MSWPTINAQIEIGWNLLLWNLYLQTDMLNISNLWSLTEVHFFRHRKKRFYRIDFTEN